MNTPAQFARKGLAAVLAAIVLAILAGCDDPRAVKPAEIALVPVPAGVEGTRFRVEQVASFFDEAAYNRKRSVYILTDRKTGRTFIGISGVGISELGSHDDGNDNDVADER